MKKFKVTVEAEIEVSFDENSPQFKVIYKNYKKHFDQSADYGSIVETIAFSCAKNGIDTHVEGLGYMLKGGQKQKVFSNGEYKEMEGYFNVSASIDANSDLDFDFWVEETDE